jgi:biotin carboxyl carrier protein
VCANAEHSPVEPLFLGTLQSIRAQNGDPVEYGQTLFVIDQRTHD